VFSQQTKLNLENGL